MKFSDYLDSVEKAEECKKLQEKICGLKEDMEKAVGIPVIGKRVKAVLAFGECENVEEFKQSADYVLIKDWDITIHEQEDGDFTFGFQPNQAQIQKITKIVGIIIGGLSLLWAIRKICRKFKKKKK